MNNADMPVQTMMQAWRTTWRATKMSYPQIWYWLVLMIILSSATQAILFFSQVALSPFEVTDMMIRIQQLYLYHTNAEFTYSGLHYFIMIANALVAFYLGTVITLLINSAIKNVELPTAQLPAIALKKFFKLIAVYILAVFIFIASICPMAIVLIIGQVTGTSESAPIILSTILLALVPLYVFPVIFIMHTSAIVESYGVFATTKRSFQLMWGNWWRLSTVIGFPLSIIIFLEIIFFIALVIFSYYFVAIGTIVAVISWIIACLLITPYIMSLQIANLYHLIKHKEIT